MADFSISLDTYSGKTGDVVIATSSSSFSSNINNNAVIFEGNIPAKILSATTSTLTFKVPSGSISGIVYIQSLALISESVQFNVLYDDEIFDYAPEANNSIFSVNSRSGATYNRDMGISNYTEVVDEDSMIQNVYNIILTKPGERLFNPDFGCAIHDILFDIMDTNVDISTPILNTIEESLNLFEPRVTVVKPDSNVQLNEILNTINVNLALLLPSGNVRKISVTFGNNQNT